MKEIPSPPYITCTHLIRQLSLRLTRGEKEGQAYETKWQRLLQALKVSIQQSNFLFFARSFFSLKKVFFSLQFNIFPPFSIQMLNVAPIFGFLGFKDFQFEGGRMGKLNINGNWRKVSPLRQKFPFFSNPLNWE